MADAFVNPAEAAYNRGQGSVSAEQAVGLGSGITPQGNSPSLAARAVKAVLGHWTDVGKSKEKRQAEMAALQTPDPNEREIMRRHIENNRKLDAMLAAKHQTSVDPNQVGGQI